MHPQFEKASNLTETIIGAAIEVHRDKGPGLVESIYEWCLLKELGLRGLTCVTQQNVIIEYKGFTREEPLKFDVLVENCVCFVESISAQRTLNCPGGAKENSPGLARFTEGPPGVQVPIQLNTFERSEASAASISNHAIITPTNKFSTKQTVF